MDLNISFRNESKEDLLNVLQKEMEKKENEGINNISNSGNFIIFGVGGITVFIPTSIKRKDDKKMNDLEKLEEVYKILTKALKGIEDVGELRDYDLDCEIDKIYNKIDDFHTDVFGLITQEME